MEGWAEMVWLRPTLGTYFRYLFGTYIPKIHRTKDTVKSLLSVCAPGPAGPKLSGYRTLPVMVAHGALNLVIEPDLLLSYFQQ